MTVELKNDISIRGTLKSVDQYLNIKLDDISVLEDIKYPHLVRWADALFSQRDGRLERAVLGLDQICAEQGVADSAEREIAVMIMG